jgi:hypothetical protein
MTQMSNYLTDNDVKTYGSEFINLLQRGAVHAVAPALQGLADENVRLQQQLAREARFRLDAQLAQAVPNYREIDQDSRWHHYLLQYDPLSGRIRQELLNDAIANGNASRVIAFFRGFLQEHSAAAEPAEQHTTAQPAARRRPTSGKPYYTRQKVAELYDAKRKGAFVGREREWAQIEADLFAAQRENRVESVPDFLSK